MLTVFGVFGLMALSILSPTGPSPGMVVLPGGSAGIGFDDPEELPDVLARLAGELDRRRAAISVPSLPEVADRYLEVLRG